MFTLLMTTSAFAQQRTWTITTAVVTAEAELVGVRGDVVYLKIGDNVESVPLARLSPADREYLASVSLAPTHSPAGVREVELAQPTGLGSEIPPLSTSETFVLAEEDIPLPGGPNSSTAVSQPALAPNLNVPPASASSGGNVTANTTSRAVPSVQRRGGTTTTARRQVTPTTNQLQSGQRGNANENENSGVLGIRDRRNSRQRGR
jgi:hypothetical protein